MRLPRAECAAGIEVKIVRWGARILGGRSPWRL